MDRRTYTFSRGSDMVVVLTNGNYSEAGPRPAAYNLSGLASFAGDTLCDALRSGVSESARWARRHAVVPAAPRADLAAGRAASLTAAVRLLRRPPCCVGCRSAMCLPVPLPLRCCVSPVPQYCVEVSEEGVALVQPSPTDEPLLLVHDNWVRSDTFFVMLHNRPVRALLQAALGVLGVLGMPQRCTDSPL